MRSSVLNNLIAAHRMAGELDGATVGNNEQFYWVKNAPGRWPRSLIGIIHDDKIEQISTQIENNELPPLLITPANQEQTSVLRQHKMREISRWEGMSLMPADFQPVIKSPEGFTTKHVKTKEELSDWFNVVKPVMMANIEVTEAVLNGFLASPDVNMVTGYFNQTPISAGLAFINNEVSGLYFIATLPEHQKKGCASVIVNLLIRESFQNGAKEVILQATPEGERMYTKLGFKSEGKISTFWKLGKY